MKGCGHKTYNSEQVIKEDKEEAKTDEAREAAQEEQKVSVLLVTHGNIILHSISSNIEVYINNQQFYNSNGLYAHKSYFSNNFKGAIFEYKAVLQCVGYDYEKFPDDFMEALLSETFFHIENEYAQ